MNLARIPSAALSGIETYPIVVEVDTSTSDKFTLVIVGLPDAAVRESKDRVLAAIKNTGHWLEQRYCTVNLAPGDVKKEGSLYDLPIAIGLLQAAKCMPPTPLIDKYLIVGELGLGGEVRRIRGALAIGILARQLGKKGVLLPQENAAEAAAVTGIEIIPIDSLKQALDFFKNPSAPQRHYTSLSPSTVDPRPSQAIDFADIKGQQHVKRALEIAAAGGHNVLLSGPPGVGKSMLAKAMAGIMPLMTLDEALEATKIHSIAGLLPPGQSLLEERPFRSPHHTVSYAGLIGGGSCPRPGEVALAHQGILFLDELPEFSKHVLEVLRQPLEDRQVTISRAQGNFTFPAHFICVAAMNPCPCGYMGHPERQCRDTLLQVERYRGKISGPLLDRIDMHIEVPVLRYKDMHASQPCECSADVRRRVQKAREAQAARQGASKINCQLTGKELQEHCALDVACNDLIKHAMDDLGCSARAVDRLKRVARTVADLDQQEAIQTEHLLEAINYRMHSAQGSR